MANELNGIWIAFYFGAIVQNYTNERNNGNKKGRRPGPYLMHSKLLQQFATTTKKTHQFKFSKKPESEPDGNNDQGKIRVDDLLLPLSI